MIKALFISVTLLFTTQLIGQNETTFKEELDVSYYSDSNNTDEYINSRCKLDIRYPENKKDFSTVVWFHGGGLKAYDKYFPDALLNADLCIVSVNYRLSPKAKAPSYLEDAGAAVAWVYNNIESYGGNSNKIFVSGHSAGGYLALMVGLDKQWLNNFEVDADSLAGVISLSGQTATHFTIREERGLPKSKTIVDEFAPLNHARENAPPLLLITGDRNIDLAGRYEENFYLERLMKTAGHTQTQLFELQGLGHSEMHDGGIYLLTKEVERVSESIDKRKKE